MATMAPTPGLRDPADFDTTRRDVYSAVLDGVRTKYPLENDTHRLELADVDYDGPETVPLKEQKQALLKRKSLYRPIKGTWRLVDKATGAVLDQKRTTVVRVPMLTQRGTYILNGSEYSVTHQMRLRPGVYVRRKENGEHEAHFNVVKGGTSFRLLLEPKTGLFRLNIGQGSVPAYPVLKEAGVADDVIRQALGDDLFKVNANKRVTESQINKAWSRLVGARAAKETGAMGLKRNFREAFEKMEMDPEVTGFTLGEPATKVAPETILKAASKLLKVSRGEAETDDRDSLAYQETLGPDDLLRERIIKDSGRVGARLLWRSTLRKNLAGIPGGALDPQMKAVFFGSGLGNALEEINPLDALDQAYRVTRMGEGGLSGSTSIPDDARMVQPSQFLFIDPIRTPESTAIGVDLRMARNTRKGSDRAMYTKLRDAKTGEEVWLPPQVMTRATIALPGARRYAEKDGQKRVAAIRGGKLVYVEPDKLEFEASSQSDMFNPMSNLLPAINSMKGGRVLMASKWFIQAMPLKEREAPLVQVDSGDGTPAELQMGSRVGAVRASKGGVVEKLTPDEVVIRHADGTTTTQDLYNNFLFNRKSHIHNTPQVRKGDVVTPGQLLATSNYTDSQGGLAMGRNLRLGYMAHKDSVYEDAVLLSEAAANKLATERLYTEKADFDNMTETGTNKYISLFPATYTRSQLDKLDDSGVVRPGTILEKGDPIMLAVRQRTPKGAGMLYRGSKSRWADASRTWDHDFQGEVTDTWQDDDGMKVAIKAYAPVEEGDKVVIRHGSKGVVSRVLPDGQMPVAPDGRPLEVILNPQGLVTRSNPSQVIEALLGKVAERKGKPYVLPQEYDGDRLQYALDELKKEGVPETDDLYDPMTGRQIKGVTTGLSYFMALHHQAESKESVRGTGSYTAEGMPTSGEDDENPKRIGSGEMAALVAHGAPSVIREVKTVRGQRNDDYWNAIAMGYPPPAPGVPQIYNKFMDSLKAAGINIRDSNGRMHLAAMTDSDVDKLAAGEITEPATIKWLANFERGAYGEASPEPVPGGLFDRGITGGHGGNRFGFIRLPEPMPSPAFETQIKRILGMTTSKFENVLAGREEIEGIGTGPQSMLEALRRIKPDEELDRLKGQYRVTSSATARDELLKRMRALDGVVAQGIKPADLMITKVPVLPPVFRPVNVNSKFSAIASPNVLYMDLLNANKNFKELQTQVTGEPVSDARMAVYGSLKAVIGMGDPIKPSRKKQNVRGILDEVFGAAGPKTSLVQRSLIGGTTDLAGRGVITPDPNLDMDHIGVPENMAWSMFGRYAVRALSRQMGDSPDSRMKAVKLVADRDPRAKQALLDVMKDHPVMASRAPVLHKFGIMGFEPVLVPGKTIRLSPGLCETFGADFDGDENVGKVVILLENAYHSINRHKKIDNVTDWCIVGGMKSKNMRLPVYNSATHTPVVVDLEDFPHGELERRVDGKKGPIEFYAALPGTHALAYDEAEGHMVWAPVSNWSKHLQREIEVVYLKNGRQIITDDDPRAVYGVMRDGNCLPGRDTPTRAAARHAAVPVVRDVSVPAAEACVESVACKNATGGALPLTADSGYWLGAIAGDGWWSKRAYASAPSFDWQWHIADLGGHVAGRVAAAVSQLFPDIKWYRNESFATPANGRYGNTVKHTATDRVYGKDVCEFLSAHLGGERDECTSGSANKRLPAFTFAAPRKFREGMLCGLIDTDGSVSVSNAKGRPQLLVSFTSTSLRLCRDVRFLCATLGIFASIGIAKETTAGNTAWIVSISSVDCKRENALVGLAVPEKRDAFMLTAVDEGSPAYLVQDMVPFPKCVKDLVVADISPNRAAADATQAEKDAANRMMTPVLAAYKAVKANLITRYSAKELVRCMEQRRQEREQARSRAVAALERAETGLFSTDDGALVSRGLRAVSEKWWLQPGGHAAASKLMQAATRCGRAGRMSGAVRKQCLDLLLAGMPCSAMYADCVMRWMTIVAEESVRWTGIDRVEYTGVKEDGYDLTVPGYETFMDEQGVVLSNTMNVHAVVTSDAAKEVRERMLPSRNARSPADFGPLFTPRHEFLYGLYAASSRRRTDKVPTAFKRASDALAAFKRGELDIDDEVEIVE